MRPGALFAVAPAALGPLLARELAALGARAPRQQGAGVAFTGDLALAYRVCLWSRLASRVLLPLASLGARDPQTLYRGARRVEWEHHLTPDHSFAVDCTCRNAAIGHSRYAALRVKDAVADRFREIAGRRPSVDTQAPDLRLHLHLSGEHGRLYLDLAGDALNRRGYRAESGPAPLRETLAAALLMSADWAELAAEGRGFLDPMCGSGTLLVEAAAIATDSAPGLGRTRYGFSRWLGHRPDLWQKQLDEARARAERGRAHAPPMLGSDRDPRAVDIARRNLQRAGFDPLVSLRVRPLADYLTRERGLPRPGLLASNPPYGERLADAGQEQLRASLARLWLHSMREWRFALLLPDDRGWPDERTPGVRIAVRNAALPCRIQVLPPAADGGGHGPPARTADRAALANRLAKNLRRLRGWRQREAVDCFRVYDADLPEFAFAVDVYEAGARWVHAQEYAPPPEVPDAVAADRRGVALDVFAERLGVPADRLVHKQRRRQRGRAQYPRLARDNRLLEVREHGCRLLVNLHDHLDTGLFLDHRPLRRWLQRHAAGKTLLNLFAYTGAASAHAALGGARATLSVDLSSSYVEWGKRNLALNGFGPPCHAYQTADCLQWLTRPTTRRRFDLILLDPPTFSNSKRMRRSFDVQRDHGALLRDAAALLTAHGLLLFSTHRRGFALDPRVSQLLHVDDWTERTLDPDFRRRPPPHRCFALRLRRGADLQAQRGRDGSRANTSTGSPTPRSACRPNER